MTKSFDEFLQESFMRDEPESVRSKDTFEDDFDNWVSRMDAQELIDYGDKYGDRVKTETAEMVAKTITDNFGIVTKGI